jgi:tRNA_anti-like
VLFAAYEGNEIAADQRFKGKRVVIAGEVERIGKDILDTPFLYLGAGGGIFGVQLMFPKSAEPDLATHDNGETIKAQCRVDGKFGSVIARDCELVR